MKNIKEKLQIKAAVEKMGVREKLELARQLGEIHEHFQKTQTRVVKGLKKPLCK